METQRTLRDTLGIAPQQSEIAKQEANPSSKRENCGCPANSRKIA